jgi:hypothetical protein
MLLLKRFTTLVFIEFLGLSLFQRELNHFYLRIRVPSGLVLFNKNSLKRYLMTVRFGLQLVRQSLYFTTLF